MWLPFELQPETPPEGRLLTDKFQPHEISAMFENLRQHGKRYGMIFNDHDRASNSHLALLAGEFAKDTGRFEEFHENVFKAFFTDHKDIGQPEILLEIAAESKLKPEELTNVFNNGRYKDRLESAATEAKRLGIRSIPAFVFEEGEIIFGVLSPNSFRDALRSIENRTYIKPLI